MRGEGDKSSESGDKWQCDVIRGRYGGRKSLAK